MAEQVVVFAGGSCGTSMYRAGEKLAERCRREGLPVRVVYVNLWTSDALPPGTELVVEMFPYYKHICQPVVSGRAFINGRDEEATLTNIIERLKELGKRRGPFSTN